MMSGREWSQDRVWVGVPAVYRALSVETWHGLRSKVWEDLGAEFGKW